MAGRPPIFDSPDEFERAANKYFDRCDAEDEVYTVNGLALALGMCRKTLLEYADKPGFSNVVKAARTRLEHCWEKRLVGPNAAGTIFWLKNQGWSDKTESEVYGKDGNDLFPTRVELVAVDPK
jgi:hypothetical protein